MTKQELDAAVGLIRRAFEELNTKHTAADTDFKVMAVNILGQVQFTLSEAEFERVVDRLCGAMAGFCRNDRDQSAA
jgi:hypothetical protein